VIKTRTTSGPTLQSDHFARDGVVIRCIKFRPYEKNTLKGFVDLELTRVGLVLRDCTWHRHPDGKEWVGFPAKSYEGNNGNTLSQPLIEFAEGAQQARREQFRRQALEAIHVAVDEQNEEAVS
jgi:hypothetical protein